MNRNPIPIVLPCHRVIGASGSLTGYGGGLDKKEHLLRWKARFSSGYGDAVADGEHEENAGGRNARPPSVWLERRAIGVIDPRRSAAPAIAASAPAISSTRSVLCALKLMARMSMPGSWRAGGRTHAAKRRAELVPHSPRVHDPAVEPGRAELDAEPRRVRLDRPGGRDAGIAPDVAEQMLAREDPVGIGCELHEQRVLLLRDVDLAAAREHPARPPVDDELAEIEHLAPRRAAAQERTDPRDELFVHERPRQVVVAALERTHLRLRIGPAEHDHRAIGHAAAIERVGITEQEHVRIGGARQLVGAREREHVEAVAPELPLEEAAHRRFGLCEQECSHARDSKHARARAPDVLSRESVTSRLHASGADVSPEASAS